MENVQAMAFLGAAIVMAVGTLGPAIGQGLIGVEACRNVGKNPDSVGPTRSTMIIAMALVETLGIYALLISGALIYVGYSLK